MEWVQRYAKGQVPTWERVSVPAPVVATEPQPETGEQATQDELVVDLNAEPPESSASSADKSTTNDQVNTNDTLSPINKPRDEGSVNSAASAEVTESIQALEVPIENTTTDERSADSKAPSEGAIEASKNMQHAVKVIFPSMLGISPITTDRFYPTMKEAEHTTSMAALAKFSELPPEIVALHPEYVPPTDALPKRNKPKQEDHPRSRGGYRQDRYYQQDSYSQDRWRAPSGTTCWSTMRC